MEGPANTAAPEPDASVLLNTMVLNVKVCRELLQQAQASLDCVEARRGPGHGARSVPRLASYTPAGALGPFSARYSLFRGLPEDSEWAQLLERQLRTRTFELLPTEQLAAALSFLTQGPTESSNNYQSAEGSQYQSEGPTLYQSALDLSHSDSTQGLQPRGGAHIEEDLSDSRESSGNSEEGSLSPPTLSLGLLHMELGELSSISHSPPHQHKMLSVLFKRHLAPRNSTPRNIGVQHIFESRPLVNSPSTSQSFCTAVDEPANHSFQHSNCNPAERRAAREQNEPEGDVYAETKRTLLFESDRTAEGEAQGTAEGEAQETAEGEAQETAEGEAQGTAEGEAQETAEGEAQGTAEGESEQAKCSPEGASEAEGTSEESEGIAEGEVYPRDSGFALDHQLYPGDIGVRTHLTPDNVQDSAQEKDSALVCKVCREKLGSEESSRNTLPSDRPEDCCSPHAHGEPHWPSLLSPSYRAHSTLDEILQAHVQD